MSKQQAAIEPPVFDEDAAISTTDDADPTPSETAPSSKEEWQGPSDWFNPEDYPETLTREQLSTVLSKIKPEWDKKSRTASDAEKQFTEVSSTLTQLQEIARAVLTDTSNETLNRYRKEYGLSTDSPDPSSKSSMPTIPKIDWSLVSDQESFGKIFGQALSEYQSNMADYVKTVAKAVAEDVRRDAEYKFQQLAVPIRETKWTNAFNSLRDKYGEFFVPVEAEIAKLISRGPYKNLYGQIDDTQLIEDIFKARYADKYHAFLSKQEETHKEQKKAAETEKIRKSPKPKFAKDDLSDDAIIARVIEEFGTEV